MKIYKSFHPYAMITILFWSLSFLFTRPALTHFSVFSLGFLRYAAASVTLLIICLFFKMPLPDVRDIPCFIASGCCGFFIYSIVFHIGLSTITSATSSVVISIAPVVTALMASLLFKEKLLMRQWVAIGIELIGILVLTMYGAVFSANQGVLWTLFAALLVSCYNLLQRNLLHRYSALQSTAYSIFAGTILLAVFMPGAIAELRTASFTHVFCILFLGVFSSAVAYLAWAAAFARAPRTSQVSNYMFFTPFLTGVLSFLVMKEVPEPASWIGGPIILFGAFLFNYVKPAHHNE